MLKPLDLQADVHVQALSGPRHVPTALRPERKRDGPRTLSRCCRSDAEGVTESL